MTPLSEIRDDEDGRVAEELVAAIEGLTKGSVPEMYDYKGAANWGEAVTRFLSRKGKKTKVQNSIEGRRR